MQLDGTIQVGMWSALTIREPVGGIRDPERRFSKTGR